MLWRCLYVLHKGPFWRACPKSTADQEFRTAFEEADYPLRRLIETPDEVLFGVRVALGRDDDRGAVTVDALSLNEISVPMLHEERDMLERPDSTELMNTLLLEEMGVFTSGEEQEFNDGFNGQSSNSLREVSALENIGTTLTQDDEAHDSLLDVFERADRMEVLVLVLEKAKMVGIVADPDSEEFIAFAHSIIAKRLVFKEQAKMGFAS